MARKAREAISSIFLCSKDGTGRLRDAAGADDSRVFLLDLSPEALGSFLLHFDLDIVLLDLVLAEVKLARIFDKNARVGVLDEVAQDVGCGLAS